MRSAPLFMFPAKAPGGGMSPARPSGLRWKLNLRGRRQMKKKLFSLVLALALCMGLTVPVSAESAASVAWLDEGFDVGDYTVRENLLPVRDANRISSLHLEQAISSRCKLEIRFCGHNWKIGYSAEV